MNKEFSLVVAKNLIDSSEQFPVDFDLAWQWLGYGTKSDAKVSFKNCGFIETFDFISFQDKSVKLLGGRPTEIIMLSIDAFKCWAMMSRTDTGKKIRQYFLECERIAKAKVTEPPKLNIYARRVQIASKWNIPEGHWCVFHEISLLANKVGEQFEVGEYELIDGSVGIHWSKYRKNQVWALPTREFYLSFGDKRDLAYAKAHAYRDEELLYFRQWLRTDYESDKMVRYLRKKYTGLAVLY